MQTWNKNVKSKSKRTGFLAGSLDSFYFMKNVVKIG